MDQYGALPAHSERWAGIPALTNSANQCNKTYANITCTVNQLILHRNCFCNYSKFTLMLTLRLIASGDVISVLQAMTCIWPQPVLICTEYFLEEINLGRKSSKNDPHMETMRGHAIRMFSRLYFCTKHTMFSDGLKRVIYSSDNMQA